MPIRKIADLPGAESCLDPDHDPPTLTALAPGFYEHTCPRCARKSRFTVHNSGVAVARLPPCGSLPRSIDC